MLTNNYNPTNLLNECTEYVEEMPINDGISFFIELYRDEMVANEEKRAICQQIKSKTKQMEKYGDANGEFSNEIAQLEVTEKVIQHKIDELKGKISKHSARLNEREYNQCVMRVLDICGSSANVKFKGEDALKYERVKEHVKQAVQAFVTRLASDDIDKCKGNYVQLLHKNEYKVLKKEIEYMSYGLFGQKYKYTANEVGLILIGCVNANGKQLKVRADVTIMNTLIKVINGVVDPNKKEKGKIN